MPDPIATSLGIRAGKFPLLHQPLHQLSPYVVDGFRAVFVGAVFDITRRFCEAVWSWVSRAFTTTATFESGNEAFDWISDWLEQQPHYSTSKDFDVVAKPRSAITSFISSRFPPMPTLNKRLPQASESIVSYLPAHDTRHWMFYGSRLLRVSRSRMPLDQMSIERIKLTLFGFSRTALQALIEQAAVEYRARDLVGITIWIADQYGNWRRLTSRPHRDFHSVVLDPETKKLLLEDAKEFLASERWYADRGIPYRRGYLLYGTPGSGKTSSIHAVASELRLDIYIIPLAIKGIDDGVLSDLISTLPDRCILLYEDIDAAFIQRSPTTSVDARGDSVEKSGISLSGILNTMDGVQAPEGRLLFATTNHPERLDPALSRPGRMDVKIEYTHATRWQAEQLFKLFYPPEPAGEKDAKLLEGFIEAFGAAIPPSKFSVAQLQGYLMRYKGKPGDAANEVVTWVEAELAKS